MVREGYTIFFKGIEMDKVKIEVIERMPRPNNINGIRNFLGHVDFYSGFIKNFSKTAKL